MDNGYVENNVKISPFYDPLISKVISHGCRQERGDPATDRGTEKLPSCRTGHQTAISW
jgi:acetyl/propionyl-CoA carboxylase alpha subunit